MSEDPRAIPDRQTSAMLPRLGTDGFDRDGPLGLCSALGSLATCAGQTIRLLARRRLAQPRARVGERIAFADGTSALVYRETVVRDRVPAEPVFLVVAFRLRWVRGVWHRLFRAESLLNILLFVGFPGFVSKLWLTHDQRGLYRGLYEWDGADRARTYVRALWWPLSLVSDRRWIGYVVVPGIRRDDVLAEPARLESDPPGTPMAWWRPLADSSSGH